MWPCYSLQHHDIMNIVKSDLSGEDMPAIMRIKGYRFFFFSLDREEPMHVHVEKGDCYAKFWMKPLSLTRSRGFRQNELHEIRRLIEQHRFVIEEKWNEHFSDKT